jgi:DNA-binding LacI/PurR family transcriptional regulator
MDYRLKVPSKKKSRWTLGFLDENLNNDFYTQMCQGVFEAASKLQVDMIRFTYYPKRLVYDNKHQVKMILDLMSQFDLDGLLFLGWSSAGPLHNEEFLNRFQSIPLLSIGTGFKDIPYVYFPGDLYFREICLHLIKTHHCRSIAYVAPLTPDERSRSYLELMREYGIYNPDLYVSEQDLADTVFEERGRRALAILLDERRTSFDAIMTTCSQETGSLLAELNRRGLRVPEDVAVTTYEDQNSAKYSSPGLTTVYFPAVEMGFCGCTKLVELLNNGRIPMETETFGKVIYRNSCGCMSSSIKVAATPFPEAPIPVNPLSAADNAGGGLLEIITEVERKKIVAGMKEAFPYIQFDFMMLLKAFLDDFQTKTSTAFISELATQLSKITDSYIQFNVRDLISVFRSLLLPYVLRDQTALLWAGNLFQQGQVMAWEKITNVFSFAKVNTRDNYQFLQEVKQSLTTSLNTDDLLNRLAESFPLLKIPSCYIFLFQRSGDQERNQTDIFDQCRLVFAYSNEKRQMAGAPAELPLALAEIVSGRESTSTFLVHLLHVTDEFMGFIMFEPGPRDQLLYQTLANQISIALRGAQIFEKLLASYQKLAEQAYWEGMAGLSIEILHHIGNILTSINVAASLLKSGADSMLISNLLEANTMLSANLSDLENFITVNPKGKMLLRFYLKLGSSFTEFKKQAAYHLNRLDEKSQAIVDLISAQQAYAGAKEVIEKVDIATVIDDTIKLLTDSINRYQIKIMKNYLARPRLLVPKIKLFQVLVHLINQAGEALMGNPKDERRMIFTITEDEDGKYIRVRHNGSGSPGNLLEKIMEYEYSDPSGHELGLNNCMKYMTLLGGKITTEPDGLGRGTTFVLWFR